MPGHAAFDEPADRGNVRCRLCPHNCLIEEGQTGHCLTRKNRQGKLELLTYGLLRASAIDPIEKKPLFHFRPGSSTLSIASLGCNLTCPFCQNHSLSQALHHPDQARFLGQFQSPEDLVELSENHGCESISFTYSEPILQFEYARDVAVVAQKRDLELIFVTNGQARREIAEEISRFINAANVDLKSFVPEKYKTTLGGSLRATTRTIEIMFSKNVWVEVTTLVIPGFNDSDSEIRDIARYLAEISPDIPWHVSRFHPAYQWTRRPSTPISTLKRAREIGLAEGLRYVYVGNLPGDAGEKTTCPSCGNIVVDRHGYRVQNIDLRDGSCRKCAHKIAGVGFP